MQTQQLNARSMHLLQLQKRWPRYYLMRVLLVVLLGYGYLAALLLTSLGLVLGSLYMLANANGAVALPIVPLIVFISFFFVLLSAINVQVMPPDGLAIQPSDAPELFSMLDALSKKLRTPRFKTILLIDQFNASVTQIPRFGLLGWHRSYLCIGLPLLQLLDKEQTKAVLAHELAHIARGHTSLGNWIYHSRLRWKRILESLYDSKHAGIVLVRPFFKWYIPYLQACTFPLARANEYQADQIAARLAGVDTLASALTNSSVFGRYIESEFWPALYSQIAHVSTPAFSPFQQLIPALLDNISTARQDDLLIESLEEKTGISNSHPCLSDRLAAIGRSANFRPPTRDKTAATLFFGDKAANWAQQLDRQWQACIRTKWHIQHEQVCSARQRLSELGTGGVATLPIAHAIERIQLLEKVRADTELLLSELKTLHAHHPNTPEIIYLLGRKLLEIGDASGLTLLDELAIHNSEFAEASCELQIDYYVRLHQHDKADKIYSQLETLRSTRQKYITERCELRARDTLLPHELLPEQLESLCKHLRRFGGIQHAWLVRKHVKYRPDYPCYVLGFTVDAAWKHQRVNEGRELQKRISNAVKLPGHLMVVSLEGSDSRFLYHLRKVAGSQLNDLRSL